MVLDAKLDDKSYDSALKATLRKVLDCLKRTQLIKLVASRHEQIFASIFAPPTAEELFFWFRIF